MTRLTRLNPRLNQADAGYANVRDKRFAGGATGDVHTWTGTTATAGSTTVTMSPAAFQLDAVGKTIVLPGAGPSGTDLVTTIVTRLGYGSVVVADAASTTVTATSTIATDDTAAIEAAHAANKAVFYPPGGYFYNGSGVEANLLAAWGAGPGISNIYLGPGKSLVGSTGAILTMSFRNLKTIGGYGAIRVTGTGLSVNSHLIVEGCHFQDYTGCAISSTYADQPYWMIKTNTFVAANNGAGTFGVSLNGDNSGSVIESNQFLHNGCHVKLAGKGGTACKVKDNDFIRFGVYTTAPRIDVWLCGPSGSGVPIGVGFLAEGNKYGSENTDSRDFRNLVAEADPATGTSAADQRPNLTTASGTILGMALWQGNLLGGASAAGAPEFLTLATINAQGNRIRDLSIAGSVAANFIKYLFTPTDDSLSSTNVIGPIMSPDLNLTGDWSAFRACNYPGYWNVVDETGTLQESGSALILPGGGDIGSYEPLSTVAATTFTTSGTATITAITDWVGGADAITVTLPAAGDTVNLAITNASIAPGLPVWVEFDARQGGGGPQMAGFEIAARGSSATRWARKIAIGTDWARYRYRWIPRTGTTVAAFRFAPTSATPTGTFQVGRVRIYHGQEPVNVDGSHLALDVRGGVKLHRTAVTTSYTVTDADCIVAVTDTSSARTITLLSAVGLNGSIIHVKDESGAAGTNNITLATSAGQAIDGSSTKAITSNWGGLRVYSDGANWHLMP